MNWCISLHWKQLPQCRQEEGETGGKRGRRVGSVERKGAGGRGEERGRRWRTASQEDAPAAAEKGWIVYKPLAVSDRRPGVNAG